MTPVKLVLDLPKTAKSGFRLSHVFFTYIISVNSAFSPFFSVLVYLQGEQTLIPMSSPLQSCMTQAGNRESRVSQLTRALLQVVLQK